MSPLDVHDTGLHDLIAPDAPIERVAGGLTFTEGPVWRGTDLLFSDIPNKRIVRWRRVLHRAGRRVGVPPQWRIAGAHCPAGAARELGLGRGWQRPLPHRAHQRLPTANQDARHGAGLDQEPVGVSRTAPALPGRSERWGVWGAMSGPPIPLAIARVDSRPGAPPDYSASGSWHRRSSSLRRAAALSPLS